MASNLKKCSKTVARYSNTLYICNQPTIYFYNDSYFSIS